MNKYIKIAAVAIPALVLLATSLGVDLNPVKDAICNAEPKQSQP